jgi:HPt (histidine-containing phosphotransfer) domain-containing protein
MPAELIDVEMLRDTIELWGSEGRHQLKELVESFAADTRHALARMREAAARADSAAVADEAHRLKGGSASLAATRLAAECVALESSAREGRSAELPGQIDRVQDVLEATLRLFLTLRI